MPPLPTWFRGRDDIRAFFADNVFKLRWRFLPCSVNGQPALAAYLFEAATGSYRLDVLNVFDLRGDRVSAITSFTAFTSALGPSYDLPGELPAAPAAE
jgi:RNA polymerase sigma-70 factor (ECF subfamily)